MVGTNDTPTAHRFERQCNSAIEGPVMRVIRPQRLALIFGCTTLTLLLPILASGQEPDVSIGRLQLMTPDLTRTVRLRSEQRASLHATGPLQGRLYYELESFAGEIVNGDVEVELGQGETERIEFPDFVFEESGIRWVRADVKIGQTTVAQ